MKMHLGEQLFDSREAAQMLGIEPSVVRAFAAARLLPAVWLSTSSGFFRRVRREPFFTLDDLLELQESEIGPNAGARPVLRDRHGRAN